MSNDFAETSDLNHKCLNQLLTESEAAGYLNLSKNTLRRWRVIGNGPVFVKISEGAIRYDQGDLVNWSNSRKVSSTSERIS